MSTWLFNVYGDEVREEVEMGMGRMGVRFMGKGREWRLPNLLYADDLICCGESEEVRRCCLKVTVDKSKMVVLNGEEGWSVRFSWIGCNCNVFQNLSI